MGNLSGLLRKLLSPYFGRENRIANQPPQKDLCRIASNKIGPPMGKKSKKHISKLRC